MERHEKIYPPKISRAADWENFGNASRVLFDLSLALAKPVCLSVFFGFGWLMFQIFLVGVFDRFGISPKVSILVSSLFFAAVFSALAVFGGLKNKEEERASAAGSDIQPICKILFIRRQKREVKI